MKPTMQLAGLIIYTATLAACASYNPNGYTNYQAYSYEGEQIYPEQYNYDDSRTINYSSPEMRKEVVVPESYHVGAYHSPASFKDRDRQWVQSQNPQSYTIEIADGDKASQVAGKLLKAPKSNRMAAVKYQREGKAYYKGVYGTYNSYEAAQQALSALPDEIKQNAQVKNWQNVQSTMGE